MGWNVKWQEEAGKDYWQKPSSQVVHLIREWQAMGLKRAADIGCGTGRHAMALAEAGFSVIALDSSPVALQKLLRSKGSLDITIIEASYLDSILPQESIDVAISYNAIYHGDVSDFQRAIHLIRHALVPGGYFFFTCPTREDGKYGSGEELAPHTFAPLNSLHPGDAHYFADESDLRALLEGFEIIRLDREEHYWNNDGARQFSSYWQVLAQKKLPS